MESMQTVFNSIIENMPDGLTDMEKARYLYIAVCKFYSYNPEFITGDEHIRKELFDEDVDINNIISNKGICSSISRALIGVFEKCGIEANGVYFKGRVFKEGHMEVAFKIDDKIYQADVAKDLMNVKLGLMTDGFAKRMIAAGGKLFQGYSYLNRNEIKELDDRIGYTYGLSDNYNPKADDKKASIDDLLNDDKMKRIIEKLNQEEKKRGRAPRKKRRIYFNDVMEDIVEEMYDPKMFGDYVRFISPDVDVNNLSGQEQDRYRIKFVMDYLNKFNSDLSEIEKRDAFEYMISLAVTRNEDDIRIFNGTNTDGQLLAIIRYAGPVAREDLFYKFSEGEPITEIDSVEVQKIIDAGFKTFAKGREKHIINHDVYFQETSYKYADKLEKYLDANDKPDEREQREKSARAVSMLQKCNEAIARYKRIVYESQNGVNDSSDKIRNLYDSFVQYVDRFEYDKYLDQVHLCYEDIGIQHLLEDMQIVKKHLEKEGEPIIKIIDEYKKALKDDAIKNKIPLYHVSKYSPEQMKDGKIKPKFNVSQFGQEFDKMVFAATEDIKTNPYIFSRANGNGMYKLPISNNVYLMEQGDVEIITTGNELKEAVSKNPTYVYYLPIDKFEPQVILKYMKRDDEYKIVFDNEWTAKDEFILPENVISNILKDVDEVKVDSGVNPFEVYAVETYNNVTQILKSNQILINNGLDKDEIENLIYGDPVFDCIENNIIAYIHNGKIRYINGELDINSIKLPFKHNLDIVYDANEIINGTANRSGEEGALSRANFVEYVKCALDNGITQMDYAEAIKAKKDKELEGQRD